MKAEIRKKDFVRISLNEKILPLRDQWLSLCNSVSERMIRGEEKRPHRYPLMIIPYMLCTVAMMVMEGMSRMKNSISIIVRLPALLLTLLAI